MSPIAQSLEFLKHSPDFVQLNNGDDYHIDLRYNTANNFVGRDMYGEFNCAFLHREAALKLGKARQHLRLSAPKARFIIFDALRPRSIQRILWQNVVGTEAQSYIANPDLGSLHNFGFAVDLSILDETNSELDMGAGFDDFRPIAQPQLEAQFLAQGDLSEAQLKNRYLLREAMQAGGFLQLPHEWWHFDALPKADVRARYQIVE